MTVFIDNAEFTQRLQRENDELFAENAELRKEIKQLLSHARANREREMEFSASIVPIITVAQSKPTGDRCVICGGDAQGGTYDKQFPVCFECYSTRDEDVREYIRNNTKGQE